MRVTHEQYNTALVAALDAVGAGRGAEPRYRSAISAFAQSLGIEVGPSALTESVKRDVHAGFLCTCNPYAREYCASNDCVGGQQVSVWVARTWADVRRGDVVRMPGQESTAAEVMELIDLPWHVNDIPPAGLSGVALERFEKSVQYRPQEHAGEWTARPATLRPLIGEAGARHRIPNVNPAAPVEIRVTRVDLDAIELLGGWSSRVAIIPDSVQ